MTSDESVTAWMQRLKDGDTAAAQDLWQRYASRLIGLARAKLESAPRKVEDEEDVALSAFKSFCIRAAKGKFPRLEDRNNLWNLLATITARKAYRLRTNPRKQDFGRIADFADGEFVADEPTPALAAMVVDEFHRLLDVLNDETLKTVALMKFEGYTNKEIAGHFDRHVAFAERKLQLIRQIWGKEHAKA